MLDLNNFDFNEFLGLKPYEETKRDPEPTNEHKQPIEADPEPQATKTEPKEKQKTAKKEIVKADQKDYEARILEIYKQQKDWILRSEQTRSDLNLAINQGQRDITVLLLKAIECISVMTGDKLFYTENARKLHMMELEQSGKH